MVVSVVPVVSVAVVSGVLTLVVEARLVVELFPRPKRRDSLDEGRLGSDAMVVVEFQDGALIPGAELSCLVYV